MLILIAAIAAQPPGLAPAFEPMAFLVGHCWQGKFESGEIDTHCFEAVHGGQHIQDRHEVVGGNGVYSGETLYSRAGDSVSFTYWNSLGGVSRGTMEPREQLLDFGVEQHQTGDGRAIRIATHWSRQGPDAYQAVTASPEAPAMNRTVTYRRVPAPISQSVYQEADGSRTIVHETIIAGPPSKIWQAIATAEGWKQWAVPTAWRNGEFLETSYAADAVPGDETTIRQQILLAVPDRLLAFRTTKAPKGFPDFESFRSTVHWLALEPVDERRTRVRLLSAGYSNDEPGRKLATFFTEGNRLSLARLQRSFETGPIDWGSEEKSARR